jgi:hypothetical protein
MLGTSLVYGFGPASRLPPGIDGGGYNALAGHLPYMIDVRASRTRPGIVASVWGQILPRHAESGGGP